MDTDKTTTYVKHQSANSILTGDEPAILESKHSNTQFKQVSYGSVVIITNDATRFLGAQDYASRSEGRRLVGVCRFENTPEFKVKLGRMKELISPHHIAQLVMYGASLFKSVGVMSETRPASFNAETEAACDSDTGVGSMTEISKKYFDENPLEAPMQVTRLRQIVETESMKLLPHLRGISQKQTKKSFQQTSL